MNIGNMTLFLSLFNWFLKYFVPEKEKFYIDDKWTIELPNNWERIFSETEHDNSTIVENIFFRVDIDLSMKIYSFNILKDNGYKKVEADIQDVATVFENIISKIENKKEYKIPNYKSSKIKSYEYTYYENKKKFYAIVTGIFMKGYLLKVNIVSTIQKEVEKSMYYLFSIKEVDPKEIELKKKLIVTKNK